MISRLIPVPTSVSDPDRLAALDAYGLLGTAPEEGFDDLVQIVARCCNTPVALVSLVASDRQWFKARVGFPACETDLNSSVCAFVLDEPDLLVIPDLSTDPRTRANPLVTGEPHIRFYAGAPLRIPEGDVLGSLCVIDHEPRPDGLTAEQADSLRRCARQVMNLIGLRRALHDRDALLARQHAELLRERRLALLTEASALLLAAPDPAEVLQPLLAREAHHLGFDQSYTYRVTADGCHLDLTHAIGVDQATRDALRHVSFEGPLCGIVAGSKTSLVLTHLMDSTEPRYAAAREAGFQAFAGYPIVSRGHLHGVISFASTREAAFDDEALEFFGTIARFLSLARVRLADEAALRHSESRYRTVFESAIDYAIIVMDLDGNVVDWSEGATRVMGWSSEEMRGKPADVIFTPEDRTAGIPDQEMHSALTEARGIDERWHLRKDGERFWANGEMLPLHEGGDATVGFVKILRDRTEQRRAAEDLQAEARKVAIDRGLLREILQQAPVGISIAFTDGSGQFNVRMQEMLGHEVGNEDEQRYLAYRAEHPDGRPYTVDEYPSMRALRQGETLLSEPMRYRNAKTGELRRWEVSTTPVRDKDGTTLAAVSFVTDVEDLRRAEEQQAILNHELSHRLKNTLAMVQAIAVQTLRGVKERDAVTAFEQRLTALSRAHDILLQKSWASADMRDVVIGTLALHADPTRIKVTGPILPLGPKAVLSLSMLSHELATNAVKYGALSIEGGSVVVNWTVSDGTLILTWTERGGPPAIAPTRSGFGSRLIRMGLAGTGDSDLRYEPDGLRAEFKATILSLSGT